MRGARGEMLTTASRRSFLRPTIATLHPFLSKARAVALPIPAEPPEAYSAYLASHNLTAQKQRKSRKSCKCVPVTSTRRPARSEMTGMLPSMLGTPTAVMSCRHNDIGPRHSKFVWKSDYLTSDAVFDLARGVPCNEGSTTNVSPGSVVLQCIRTPIAKHTATSTLFNIQSIAAERGGAVLTFRSRCACSARW